MKIKSNRGETLVETLISIIIVVISVAFLVTSVTVASKINARVKEAVGTQISFTDEGAADFGQGSMTVPGILTDTASIPVKIYKSRGYYYYTEGE